MSTPIELNKNGRVATVSINRPEMRNALNQEALQALQKTFEQLGTDEQVRVVILRGSGEEAFCAGADLSELARASTSDERELFFTALSTLIQTMHRIPQPVIALVHGFALAGGCGLAAAADIVIAADNAVFGLPELQIGLVPMVVMPVIHRAIGRRALSELVLSAERIDAARAERIGLVSRVVPQKSLEKEGEALAEKIAALAPSALRAAKELIYHVGETDYQECLRTYPKKIAALSLEEEATEGISAFLAKRKPSWR